MDSCNTEIPGSPEEVVEMCSVHENVVTGGFVPGYSTDAVAATIAELMDAELVVATRVDGVYTADPEEEEAEKLDEVTPGRLRELVSGNSSAGGYELIDGTAINIIERSSIRTRVIEGELDSLENPEEAEGTDVVSG
jgi:uridylate kinase